MKRRWVICLVLVGSACGLRAQALAEDLRNASGALSRIAPLAISNDKIGLLFSNGLEKQYGLANDPGSLQRIQSIGRRIIAATGHPETKYDFGILDGSDFNAVSIYGGRIRVFRGLLSDTRNSENELAAVLAHEIAHNELGHNKKAVRTFKITYALELTGLADRSPKLLLAGANAVLAKRSRKFEEEADRRALEWMDKAGYCPTGAVAVFRRIEAEHRQEEERAGEGILQKRFAQIFSTHPEPAHRVEIAEDYLFEKEYGSTFKMVLGTDVAWADSFVKPTDTFEPSPISQFGGEWLEKCTDNVWKLHAGVDVDVRASGEEVRASGNGIVRYAGSFGGRWGDCVILEHQTPDSGILTTLYGHINIAAGVEKGKVISQGTTLGTIDPSVQPPHLHFGIRMNPYDGLSIRGALFNCANADHRPKFPEKWVDPIRFLKDHPKAPTYVGPDRVLIIKGPFHLGDDVKDSEIHRDALFDYGQTESTLKLRVKGTPKKDPILWVNRIEVGRITTSDDEWHWHEFAVPKGYLRDGKNLFHIQSYIPDRWQTFDDCEVADVWIVKR